MKAKEKTGARSLSETLEAIGCKLMELRIKKGYTSHAQFAADYDLPRIQYWRMEKGNANITLRSLDRVLAIHDITVNEFFMLISKQNRKSKPHGQGANP